MPADTMLIVAVAGASAFAVNPSAAARRLDSGAAWLISSTAVPARASAAGGAGTRPAGRLLSTLGLSAVSCGGGQPGSDPGAKIILQEDGDGPCGPRERLATRRVPGAR